MTKQECAIKYITENYLDYNRLRHDIVSDKLQIRIAVDLESSESCRMVQSGVELCRMVQNGVELGGSELCRMVQNGVESSSAEKTTLPNTTQPLHNATQLLPNTTQHYTTATQLYTTPLARNDQARHQLYCVSCCAGVRREYHQPRGDDRTTIRPHTAGTPPARVHPVSAPMGRTSGLDRQRGTASTCCAWCRIV